VLVDEAVTPLIISGLSPNAPQVEAFIEAAALAPKLTIRKHYTVDRQHRDVRLTPAGRRRVFKRSPPSSCTSRAFST